MGMIPEDYFFYFVLGNVADYEADKGSLRLAFNAALATSHLADHWYTFNKRHCPAKISMYSTAGDYIEELSSLTGGAFRDIRSIANAYKHLYTDTESPHGKYSTLDSAGSTSSILLPEVTGLTELTEKYAEGESVVIFTRRNGSTGEFPVVLNSVVEYWNTVF